MKHTEYFMQQIGKAARVLDLKGDVPKALDILKALLKEKEIEDYLSCKFEVYSFLANIHLLIENHEECKNYLNKAESIQLPDDELDLVDFGLIQEMKGQLNSSLFKD